MKRRNADCSKLRRPLKRNRITEGIYGRYYLDLTTEPLCFPSCRKDPELAFYYGLRPHRETVNRLAQPSYSQQSWPKVDSRFRRNELAAVGLIITAMRFKRKKPAKPTSEGSRLDR